jgi:hypothetical protein
MEIKAIKNPVMTLITKAQMARLVKAGEKYFKSGNIGRPIVKLFGGPLTWLVTHIEVDPSEHNQHIAYGYADLGMGQVEFGSLFELSELSSIRTGISLLERDAWWKDDKTVNYFEHDRIA